MDQGMSTIKICNNLLHTVGFYPIIHWKKQNKLFLHQNITWTTQKCFSYFNGFPELWYTLLPNEKSLSWLENLNVLPWRQCLNSQLWFRLTHSHSGKPKQAWQFWKYSSNKNIFWKIYEGELLTRSKISTLLRIICKFSLYPLVFSKKCESSRRYFLEKFWAWMG